MFKKTNDGNLLQNKEKLDIEQPDKDNVFKFVVHFIKYSPF